MSSSNLPDTKLNHNSFIVSHNELRNQRMSIAWNFCSTLFFPFISKKRKASKPKCREKYRPRKLIISLNKRGNDVHKHLNETVYEENHLNNVYINNHKCVIKFRVWNDGLATPWQWIGIGCIELSCNILLMDELNAWKN